MNEVAKPDITNIAEALKGRIRLELLDVIPQDKRATTMPSSDSRKACPCTPTPKSKC